MARRNPPVASPPARPPRAELTRQRVFDALTEMRRHGVSIREAARRAHTTPRTMRAVVPRALVLGPDRRIHATTYDRYARTMSILTATGKQVVSISDSRTATRIAEHRVAVHRFLTTGKRDLLWPFRHKSFRAGKVGYPFLTDPQTLKRLGHLGLVGFEDLYAIRG